MMRTKWYSQLQTAFDRVAPRAKEAFSVNCQMVKAIEEMGELTRALAKRLNGSPIKDHDIMDEICDVLVMANQLRMYFDAEWIDERMLYKLNRTEKFIDLMEAPPPPLL